ncbi:envelope biogenesis factor ElyC [Thalassomonas sp. M1454]|uniref:envelope biogenesis factor ElyC n=1 Tax=Thalassomonas sp. M1454 TaxID=2594477 RepID=UPI00117D0A49|nr:envelope biogenesis factor ElyC [Thalassomonas sp. M1454]TRX56750.1 envelope biogenesis factor ElyC [Thalassomonas sp. M1454]
MELFTLKKIIGQLLMPMPLLLMSLVIVIVLFNKKPSLAKWMLTITTSLLLLLSFMPVSNLLIVNYEQTYPVYKKQQRLDYIVILGCGHTTDSKLSATQELKICSLQRLTEGVRIALLHPEAKIITSGAAIYDVSSNADKVKQAAVELGINANRIITESRPLDTEDEATLIGPIVKDSKFVLITNANHMPRSMNYFIKAGTEPIPAPTGFFVKNDNQDSSWRDYFPRATDLNKSETAWYETLGLIWQWLKS